MTTRNMGQLYSWSDIEKLRAHSYVEFHHALPQSLFYDLKDDKRFIVCLTAREHFLAHLLLSKMFKGLSKSRMALAVFKMYSGSQGQQRYINSRFYETCRIEYSVARSTMPRPPQPQSQKDKVRAKLKGKARSQETREKMKGPREKYGPQTEEHIAKRTGKGVKPVSIEGILYKSYLEAVAGARIRFNIGEYATRSRLKSDKWSDWYYVSL